MPVAYLDGKFVEQDQIRISPFDYGFARGMTLFEFTRVYGSVPFHLEEHVERFIQGAKFMDIPLSFSAADLAKAARAVTAKNNFAQSGIKFYLTIGECGKSGGFGFKQCADFTPHLMMIEEEVKPQHPEAPRGLELYRRGAALKTVPFARQTPEAKTINYAPGFIAARHLNGTDYDEILFLHPDGYATETTISNFFCVIDGALHTASRNMLLGVTRGILLNLAKELGIPVIEGDIPLQKLSRATEAFITGTFLEMCPVRKIDDIDFKQTMDAPVFAKLRQAFTAHIAEHCKAGCA